MEQADSELFPIGEASREVGLSTGTLRLWESEGLIKPSRSKGGTRYYSKEDVARLRRIKRLRTIDGLNFAAIRREVGPAMQSPREDDEHNGKSLKAKRMGAQLRRLRARHRKTLKEVAQEAGLSVSFLSALERGDTGASVASLRAVAKVYGATMREIFGADLRKSSRLVRPGDRPVMEWDNGVRYEELADSRSLMDPTYVYVPPNASSGGFYSHDGEEFMYVLSGTVFVELEGEGRHRLEAKDTFYWPSTIPHRWWTEDEEAEILYVNTPPTF